MIIQGNDKHIKLRNWLNILFIIGAIAGIATFYMADHETGLYIIMAAMVFKFIEVIIRILKI
ncbi:MAG: hypothetical protein IJ710_03900 [Prevotella sp.]|nr:hypothetical protein [Prevotella sp.]